MRAIGHWTDPANFIGVVASLRTNPSFAGECLGETIHSRVAVLLEA